MTSQVSKYAVITDNPFFAASATSYLYKKNEYVPILSLPRMNRPDWESEVLKRTDCLNRFNIKKVFCRGKDYAMLAPFRKYSKAEVIPIKSATKIPLYINYNVNKNELVINPKGYIKGLIDVLMNNRILAKDKNKEYLINDGYYKIFNKNKLLVLEVSGEATDISAINYAFANEFDLLVIKKIKNTYVNEIENALVITTNENIDRFIKYYKKKLSYILDLEFIENNYESVQFISNKLFLGFLINKIPTAHLLHLQSELNLLNEYYYLDELKRIKIPSFLFVDTQEEDISSEVPEIINNLNQYKSWRFHLNGKFANMQNFKMYSHFFPYDVLLISAHGSSPEVRKVTYKFTSSDSKQHIAKLIEYYEFGRVVDDKIEVRRKYYPLEFDGINWKDKQALKKANISHIFKEFVSCDERFELIKSEPYLSNKIEGIKLNDGVFMGAISSFERDNNPIVVLNSCGSIIEAGRLVSFGLPRILIGTLWSVNDSAAKSFAVSLFNRMSSELISKAFFEARNNILDLFTKSSYIMIGTLNQFLYSNLNVDVENEKKLMANRILESFRRAISLYKAGHIDYLGIQTLSKLDTIISNFVESNCPNDQILREKMRELKKSYTKL